MTESSDHGRLSPDDALPPVTVPSAKFLIPLFVIPFCIVSSIVVVWALFSWLAQQGGDPQVDIDALGRDNAYRWQAAHNLANALQNPRYVELREDAESAKKLSDLLAKELAEPLPTDADERGQDQNLRVYLCRALGEFLVPDGVPVLILAAKPTEGDADLVVAHLPVRLAALEALSVTLGHAYEKQRKGDWSAVPGEILPSLMAAADFRSDDSAVQPLATQVRMRAAFGLGLEGSDAALNRLERMMVDPSPDVRYNAATGLARNGDIRALPLLTDMLNPKVTEGVNAEAILEAQPAKRRNIYEAALLASEKLLERNTRDDMQALRDALTQFANASGVDDDLRIKARELLITLEKRPQA